MATPPNGSWTSCWLIFEHLGHERELDKPRGICMNAEVFAEWFRRQGHRVVRTASSYWCDAGPRVYQAFPYHWLIQPSAMELSGLLIGKGAVALRYSTPFDAIDGKVSYHVVLEGSTPYELETLRAQARNGVRRGPWGHHRSGPHRHQLHRLSAIR